MGKIIYRDPVERVTGRLTKDGSIHRQKFYHNKNGKIIGVATQESYYISNPRDWKRNPPKPNELAHQLHFRQACNQTTQILKADKPNHSPANEETETLNYWKNRFEAQLEKGETEAPIDPKTRKHKIYLRLDNFIRAAILRQLDNQNN